MAKQLKVIRYIKSATIIGYHVSISHSINQNRTKSNPAVPLATASVVIVHIKKKELRAFTEKITLAIKCQHLNNLWH